MFGKMVGNTFSRYLLRLGKYWKKDYVFLKYPDDYYQYFGFVGDIGLEGFATVLVDCR